MISKQGAVVKKSGIQTLKVEVTEYRTHPKYQKRFRVTKNFLVHDEGQKANVGDTVTIVPCRPLSKRKFWKMQSIVSLPTKDKK